MSGAEKTAPVISYVGSRTPMTIEAWIGLGWPRAGAARLTAVTVTPKTHVLKITRDGVEPLRHIRRHSPDGFGWGYNGSGPADLALAILCDHLDLTQDTDGEMRDHSGARVEDPPYQEFKFDVVAGLPAGECWLISSATIAAFLARTGRSPG